MQLALYAVLSLGAALALDAYLPSRPLWPSASQGTDLGARLVGTWKGNRTTSISSKPQAFTMSWKKAPDGHLTGSVAMPGQPTYPVTLVWSSDTAFIYESAAHLSQPLHARVVTRATVHFKGKALQGTFEARPSTYEGKTITGTFTAARSA